MHFIFLEVLVLELGRLEQHLDDLAGVALHPLLGSEHLGLPLFDELCILVKALHQRASVSVEPLAQSQLARSLRPRGSSGEVPGLLVLRWGGLTVIPKVGELESLNILLALSNCLLRALDRVGLRHLLSR